MENMKEELYKELHIMAKEDKEIINELIRDYSIRRTYDYNEMKALVKTSYKAIKLNKAIELYNKYKETIFINGMLIFNYVDTHNREIHYELGDDTLDCWFDDRLVFSIKFELVRTIETHNESLYREDETLLWQ